jgi:3-hydroxyisobutyrate dehydrogenase
MLTVWVAGLAAGPQNVALDGLSVKLTMPLPPRLMVPGGRRDGTKKWRGSRPIRTPVLGKLSSKLRFIGRSGQAAQVKALVNMIMNANTAALAEGLGLGHALGLDLTMLHEVFAAIGAVSQVLKTDGEDMQLRAHDCFFSAAHAAEDSGIAWRMGCEVGLDLPVVRAKKEQYDGMVALGLGDLEKSGVAELTFPDRRAELRR